jgi:hypothetical protein
LTSRDILVPIPQRAINPAQARLATAERVDKTITAIKGGLQGG